MAILNVLPFAHELTRRALRPGSVAVDATAGNGHDTVHLASTVGEDGRVYSIDVQEQAVKATRHKIDTRVPDVDVRLIHGDHAALLEHIEKEDIGQVGAVMFNLGYLPRGDHDLITTPETTLPALDAALDLLQLGGVITIVLYTGHDGGPEEADAVHGWARALPQHEYRVLSYRFTNRENNPPRLLAVEKR
ncbi:16S rRNA (cytosine(1402)-N(4))-methyltransferase [Longibacter salinarum]|uniref:16S rRNA (Cytosine(1402)-N(4))-methyltransferase n=1 Tax=Longibacter salinarum TaxID=1850348 RepID=A0A2A8D2R6_9BACT|nr:class I SAM-dependent methyltransferase [Longibacter salinarum]PEN15245.1 16S rRNA (cytosine(1402)-N(4))-methyltransferase [Longibacter salinarum]